MCNTEKHINKFYKRYPECKDFNRTKELKRYHENKDKISLQQKIEINIYYRNKSIDVYKLLVTN